ncbi:MAG: hypothetical protein HFJ50_07700 [Clostridia bacterium]|nr:hypothetical protein [Clostridia bacterium]
MLFPRVLLELFVVPLPRTVLSVFVEFSVVFVLFTVLELFDKFILIPEAEENVCISNSKANKIIENFTILVIFIKTSIS